MKSLSRSLIAIWVLCGPACPCPAGTVLSDHFATSTLNSASPVAPTSASAAYHLFSSKSWNPTPAIAMNDLKFGIVATTSGHLEAQARFSASPITLTHVGDFLELTVTFTNTLGLWTLAGHVGFGFYNSGGVDPIAGGMNSTAVTNTTGITGGAQGWQGYVARVAYDGGTHRIATRPAQYFSAGNNQDLVTEGSSSQSYTGAVSLASTASTFTQSASSQLTEQLRLTLSAANTFQIESRLFAGADTNGTLLVSQSASASGANFLTNSFDALAFGWRAMANTTGTLLDVKSLTVTTSVPLGGPGAAVAGLYFQPQPADANVGVALTPAITVVATNASGGAVTNAPVTLSLNSGSGALNGTLTQATDANGIATFATLSLSTPGAKQLQAVSGPASVLSAPFSITGIPPVALAFAPTNGATGICVDTLLHLTFDQPVLLRKAGTIRIYDATDSTTPVDTLDLGANVNNAPAAGSTWNTATNVQARTIGDETFTNHPVSISSSAAGLFPHSGVLATNKTYFVLVDTGVFTDTNGTFFPGITDTNAWRFTTRTTGPVNATNLIVAADGSGDFCTVQGAVDFVPAGSTTPRIINVRNGTYPEIVNVNNRNHLTFRGQTRAGTIIAYDNNSTMFGSTHQRMVFKVNAHDIALDNLTITNTTPKGGSQAEALMVETDRKRFIANNVNLCSYQDTILMNTSGTQCYFRDSLVQGDVDFIWGGGNAFFTNCEIKSLFAGYLVQPRTSAGSNGLSFVNCRLTKNGSLSSSLGRSLSNPDGNTAFINCLIDAHITGWTDANTRYWEFGNSNLTGTAAVTYNGTQLAANSADLTNARTAVLWLNGWTPQLSPNLLTQPTNQTVISGLAATFNVYATGLPDPGYQWRKNGVDIPGATAATFSIASALPSDAGAYSVIVSNTAGSVLSSNATLTVNIPQAPAFPGAEGAGAYAAGGRGGDVYYVTTLADSGAGSLRNGISGAPASGRTILFKVSGNIVLNSTLTVNKPRITVAGQTAPGDGICFQNYSFNIAANDVIVRHVRTRLGTNAAAEVDSMWIAGGTNVIVDHVSASWSVDETLSATGPTANLSVQWCFITESLNNSIHSKGAHGYGSLITPSVNTTFSWHHNLYAHNNSRNPRPGTDAGATVILDFRNNTVYNYGGKAGYGSDWDPDPENLRLNYVANYVVAGPDSSYNYVYQGGGTNTFIYQATNLMDLDLDSNFDGVNNNFAMFSGTYVQTNTSFAAPAIITDAASVALQRVLALGGAMPWRRDAADQRIIGTVRHHNGQIIDAVAQVGTWPTLNSATVPVDTDSDGMPDYWELATGLNPNLATDRNTTNVLTGYTRLEEYLNWLADAHELCDRNGRVDVDLRDATGGATNLTYAVASGMNGTATLRGDGHTARFLAAVNTNGAANFTFTATDPANATTFGPVNFGILITTTNAPNTAPTLSPISNRTLIAGATLTFTNSATDPEAPPQTLTFSLPSAPVGASVNASNGVFHWRPTIAQVSSTNTLQVVVTDNGSPILSATQNFSVVVNLPARPVVQTGGAGMILSINGEAGPDYTVQASTNLLDWLNLLTTNPVALPFNWTDGTAGNYPRRFYRVVLGP